MGGGGNCPPGKCTVLGGGKSLILGVVNVWILGVVNVCLANDLPPFRPKSKILRTERQIELPGPICDEDFLFKHINKSRWSVVWSENSWQGGLRSCHKQDNVHHNRGQSGHLMDNSWEGGQVEWSTNFRGTLYPPGMTTGATTWTLSPISTYAVTAMPAHSFNPNKNRFLS